MPTFQSTCPRHCYGSCGIISHVNGKKLARVLGDPEHGFTRGRLCPKGYALIQYARDEHRIKYPMKQVRRGSGEWRRISWDQAYDIIADKLIELNGCYGSNLAAGYFKGLGHTGFLHDAVQGMFAGLGPHTRPAGDICSASGEAALTEVFDSSGLYSSDPETMAQAGSIVLWGANPAVTNINQMKFIYEARKKGAPLLVIDPIFTRSAERADLYLQINPDTDSWLAWGVAKLLLAQRRIDNAFLQNQSVGWEAYAQALKQLDLDEVCSRTGVRPAGLEELADYYANFRPSATWLGFGLQRHRHGVEAVKAISALPAITGSFASPGGGIYFRHRHRDDFPQALAKLSGVRHPTIPSPRDIPVYDYAREALALQEPPLKMLWVSCGNPLAQEHNLPLWNALWRQLEFTVTVDLYLTRTARQSDLVLPAASFFETEDLHLGFWHHWLSVNEKILPAFYEAKSDLQIARELTEKLNALCPGFSNFPAGKDALDWLSEELSPRVRELYGVDSIEALHQRSYKRRRDDLPSTRKYRFSQPQPELLAPVEPSPPYYLLTPQSLLRLHTQYETLTWLHLDEPTADRPVIELSAETARRHHLDDGNLAEIYNEYGVLRGRIRVNTDMQPHVLVVEQSDNYPVNTLINFNGGESGSVPYFDCRVDIRKTRGDADV